LLIRAPEELNMLKKMAFLSVLLIGLALPGLSSAKEVQDQPMPRPLTKDTPRAGRFHEASKIGAPADKYDYIYRVKDRVRAPERHDVI
jgi:hypothetical protein